jgi:hypothetical protein
MEEESVPASSLSKQALRRRRRVNITAKFMPRFWEDSDNRISVVKLIRRRYELLKSHAGGHESVQRDMLCQRCAFVSVILETKEVEAAEGKDLDMGSYIAASNALVGLLRALGLEKRMKSAGGLQAYLDDKGKE